MDPYRKYAKGSPLPRDAATINTFAEAARAERDRRLNRRSDDLETIRRGDLIRVKNESGSDLPRGSILGLDEPIFLPSQSFDAFLREVTFRGVTPTSDHFGRFAVMLEPVLAGAIARGWIAGATQARVLVDDPSHTCADVTPGSTEYLTSAEDGSAQILWVDPESYGYDDAPWAVVRLASSCGGSGDGGPYSDRCDCPETEYEVVVECGACTNPYADNRMPKYWRLTITGADESAYYEESAEPCPGTECQWLIGSTFLLENEANEYGNQCVWVGVGRCGSAELRHTGSFWQLTIFDHADCVLAVYTMADDTAFACCGANDNSDTGYGYDGGEWQIDDESPCSFAFTLAPHECTCCPEPMDCTTADPGFTFCTSTDCCYLSQCSITVTVGGLFNPTPVPCAQFDPDCYELDGDPCPFPVGDPGRLGCWKGLPGPTTSCGGMNGVYSLDFAEDCTWRFEGVPGGGSTSVVAELVLSGFNWTLALTGATGQVAVFTSDECPGDPWACERSLTLCWVDAESTCEATSPAPTATFTLNLPGA